MSALIVLGVLSLVFGLLLGYADLRFKVEGDPIVDQIDALLPQTQCGQCGLPGCRAYAEMLASGDAEINQCAPGGEATLLALADLLGRDPVPLDESEPKLPSLAFIIESDCIGCTKCILSCPVDAIVGATKQMHTVIATECTGCELCLPACPVDCIIMKPIPAGIRDWTWMLPDSVEAA